MAKRSFSTMQNLISEQLADPKYQPYLRQCQVTNAWEELFPNTKKALKRLILKGSTLYVVLDSLILANELRKKERAIVAALDRATAKVGPSIALHHIVFSTTLL